MPYLANDLEECKCYFDRLDSPALGWSFTVNHAHIKPNKSGEGTIDFPAMFAASEASGYRGHYMRAFGSLDDMLAGRETLAALAKKAARK